MKINEIPIVLPPLYHDKIPVQSVLWPKYNSIWFMKNADKYGIYGNMYHKCPFTINGNVHVQSVEHLYQSMRFPHNADIQKEILNAKNGFIAKCVSRKYISDSNKEWVKYNLDVMYWAMCIKAYTYAHLSLPLLKEHRGKFIVEHSEKDAFWGAKENKDFFEGINMCGRIWLEITSQMWTLYNDRRTTVIVDFPQFPNLTLLNQPLTETTIQVVWELHSN